ncbi:hypothetical protein C8J57DRAFT_1376355 [Mycena rebaudengoi]|nr:hypothetical protein C8J57DRAFT_1376355 [Mycena rebaudengoi]
MPANDLSSVDMLTCIAFLAGLAFYGLATHTSTATRPVAPLSVEIRRGPIIGIAFAASPNLIEILGEQRKILTCACFTGDDATIGYCCSPIEYDIGFNNPLQSVSLGAKKLNSTSVELIGATMRAIRVSAEKYHRRSSLKPFDDDARAQLAGLAPIRLLDESVAVAIAYGVDHLPGDSADSVSYSALLSLTTGTLAIHAITQSSDIDPELALDARILDFVVNRYANLTGSPLEEVQVGAIREQVDMVKVVLSFDEVVFVEIPRVDDDYIQVPLTRGDLTALSFNLFNSTMFRTLDQVLHSAGIQARDVNQMILTGRSAYIPAVKRLFSDYFLVPPESQIYVQNMTPMRFGIEVDDGAFATLIPPYSPLPARYTRSFNLTRGPLKIFTGTSNHTNTTEFLGAFARPPNATASEGSSRSMLLEPRRPSEEELAQMAAYEEARAKREDIDRRMTHLLLLQRHISSLPADDPKRASKSAILVAMDDADAWLAAHMHSASWEEMHASLTELEQLLSQDVALSATPTSTEPLA